MAATGKMAEGFEAEQSDASGTGLVSCTHPGSDMWFVGTGQSAGATQIWLYLMNTGNVAASVDVTILTDTGQQNGLSSAITVAPGQSVAENITPFVSGSQALALHVQANAGQVAASVWQGGSARRRLAAAGGRPGDDPGDPRPDRGEQRREAVRSGSRLDRRAAEGGGLHPGGRGDPVPRQPRWTPRRARPPRSTLNSLGASAAGLRLTSNVPIVAGVLVPGAGIGSFTTAVPPVTEQGVVAGNPAARGVTVGLLLTAPSAAARASISVISADGTVTTPAGGGTVTVAPATPSPWPCPGRRAAVSRSRSSSRPRQARGRSTPSAW